MTLDDGALVVFARQPVAGEVKTRLISALGGGGAASLYQKLLCHVIAEAEKSNYTSRWIYVAEARQLDYFRQHFAAQRWQIAVQCEGDIGARMAHAIEQILSQHAFMVILGSDIADVTADDLNLSYQLLATGTEVVIGPSHDGGYWLVGLRKAMPALFENIPWSTPEVFARTVEKIEAVSVGWRALAMLHDIDRPEDLAFMR